VSFLPTDGRNHLRYSLHLSHGGTARLSSLGGLDEYRYGRPAKGRSSPIPVLTGLDVVNFVDVTNAVTAAMIIKKLGVFARSEEKRQGRGDGREIVVPPE